MASAPRLARICIASLKSFADPITLDLLPGLTGLVGPNGCGKSNLADALRWVVSEASLAAALTLQSILAPPLKA